MSGDLAGGARPRHRVAVLQSNYIPWKGYFDIIRQVDRFVFHDDLQYTKNDWRNRNRIKTPAGPEWLTIPCGTDEHRLICDVRIDRQDWQAAHWRRLEASYRAAAGWAYADRLLRPFYLGTRWRLLSDLNQALIRAIAKDALGLATQFDDSRRLRLTSRKTERLVELLVHVGATDYLSGPAAKAYLEPARFAEAGIALHFMDYTGYPAYPQHHGAFVHEVSVVDLIAHTGPDAVKYLDRGAPAETREVTCSGRGLTSRP